MKLKELFFILSVSRIVQSGPFFPMDQCECGKSAEPSASARIFGGNETKRGEFPWTVGLFQVFSSTIKMLFFTDVLPFSDIQVDAK